MRYILQLCFLSIALSGTINCVQMTPAIESGFGNSITQWFSDSGNKELTFGVIMVMAFIALEYYFSQKQSSGTSTPTSYSSPDDSSSYSSDDTQYHEVETSYSTPVTTDVEKEEKKEEAPTSSPSFIPFTYDSSDPELDYLAAINSNYPY